MGRAEFSIILLFVHTVIMMFLIATITNNMIVFASEDARQLHLLLGRCALHLPALSQHLLFLAHPFLHDTYKLIMDGGSRVVGESKSRIRQALVPDLAALGPLPGCVQVFCGRFHGSSAQ